MSTQSLDIIYAAIDVVNDMEEDDMPLEKSPETKLFGTDGGIDSLSLINLVVAAEKIIETETGKTIALVQEDIMSMENNPFATVASLADPLDSILAES